jgi:hypothetical protein
LLERIAKDPHAFIIKQDWRWRGLASGRMTMWGSIRMPWEAGRGRLGLIFLDPLACATGGSAPLLEEPRSIYEHLQVRILEMIETLDELRASAEMEIFREVEQDESVIDKVSTAQREEEIEQLVGSSPF